MASRMETSREPSRRRFGLYVLVSPGATATRNSAYFDLRASTMVRMAVGSEEEGIAEVSRHLDERPVDLIDLGGGWTHTGMEKLLTAVAGRSLVAVHSFPEGELPEAAQPPYRRAVLFFCSTPETRAYVEAPRDRIWFEGVLDRDAAIAACERLVREHDIQILEVCSDWGFVGAARAQDAVGPAVKVGVSLHQAADSGRRSRALYVPDQFVGSAP